MKITKDYPGLRLAADGENRKKPFGDEYILTGDLASNNDIIVEIDGVLIVLGNIVAKGSITAENTKIVATEDIKAGGGIKAGRINAGGGIRADGGIEAGGDIKAKTFIDCGKRIFAGISMYRTSKDCNKTIKCAELRHGEICYGELVIVEE